MGRVARTPPAVLLELDPVPAVVPVLLRYVVSPLALTALERYMDALVAGHFSSSPNVETFGVP
jgi:hypothetical protein